MSRGWILGGMILAMMVGMSPLKAYAIERGMPAYANGAQNFFAGLVPPPPPGFYVSYGLFNYQADKYAGLPGILSFHFEAVSNAVSLSYIGDFKILGANYSAAATIPLVYFGAKLKPNAVVDDAKLSRLLTLLKDPPKFGPGGRPLTPAEKAMIAQFFQTPQGKITAEHIQQRINALKTLFGKIIRLGELIKAFGNEASHYANDYQTGLGNSTITPIALGWHFGDFHLASSFNMILPGTYHRDSAASPSQNYFTFMPALGLTWLPKWGLEANLVLMYDFPTVNNSPMFPAQNYYQSGQAIHFDYCVNYVIKPSLRFGFAGYYYQQTTPDKADGHTIGNHARVFGIGPAMQYNPTKALTLQVINQWETAAMNTTEGYRVWFNVKYGF